MRLAFVGKGGSGKSAIAGTFARFLARRGHPVLAVDSDPLPGLAFSLGLDIDDDVRIPDEAVRERREGERGPRFKLVDGLDVSEAVERWSVHAPDGVRFLQFGKVNGQAESGQRLWRSQLAFRQITHELPDDYWHVVGDLPGGTRQAFTGWGNFARTALVVVEPTAAGALSARRLARMIEIENGPERVYAIANKVRAPDDAEMVAARTGLEVIAAVPWDEAFAEAERRRRAPIDDAPDSDAVREVELLVERVLAKEPSGATSTSSAVSTSSEVRA
jgi:CO dehydrogenase maturation factor